MEGGALIAQGAYGCIFDKPLECKRKGKKDKSTKIAKLTEDIDANQEINIANELRDLPLANNYFILADPESCTVKPIEKQDEEDIDDCNFLERVNLQYTKQIYMNYGGKAIYSMNLHPSQFHLLKFMIHMLEAAGTLLLGGICHYYIHPGNIVVDTKGGYRLIDFGMAFKGPSVTKSVIDLRWKVLRFGTPDHTEHWISNQEPPEVTIINAVANNEFPLEAAIQKTVYTKNIFGQVAKPLLGISRASQIESFQQFWRTSKACRDENWLKFFKLYWSVFDSWSLGTLFFTYLQTQLSFYQFTTSDTWKDKQGSIRAALRGMLDINPRNRLDAIEVLALLDPGNHWLNRFASSWLSEKAKQRKLLAASDETV
jgi:serine/threonine protein kinase